MIVIAHLTGTISEGSEEIVQEPMTSQSLKAYFCADTVFNLSKTIRTEIEIKLLKRGLRLVPTPNLINEADI